MRTKKYIFVIFEEFTKAFHTAFRTARFKVLSKLSVLEKMVHIIISFHEAMKAFLKSRWKESGTILVSNGTTQVGILALLLFALFFSAMLLKEFSDLSEKVNVGFRTSESLYKQHRFKEHLKFGLQLVCDILFADDAAQLAASLEGIETILDKFSETANAFGLIIYIKILS